MKVPTVVVSGSFDDLRSNHVRFLQGASQLGELHVLLWPDEAVAALEGKAPKFPQEERLYLLQAIRYVSRVWLARGVPERDALALPPDLQADFWVVTETEDNLQKRKHSQARGIGYHILKADDLSGFPMNDPTFQTKDPNRNRVVVTGCYDWFHSGHVRFFEEVSALGDLYVVVGHDANVRLLKGAGHPLFPQEERRYMVQAVRFVKEALVSSGQGWMDAEPEIEKIRPHIYAVNEDGDVPQKRKFCEEHGLEYVVLKRKPKEGLPKRESTYLRGF